MAKSDRKLHEARMAGAAWLMDVIKTQGMEAAEKELKVRGAMFVPLEVNQKQLDKVIGQIHMLDDITYMEILFKKYIEYKTLKDIAVEMKYSYGRTKHIHGFALEAFRIKVLENSAPNSTI